MRQKYRICQYIKEKILNIQELVVDEKDTKKGSATVLRDDHYDLIAEQQYDAETVARSVAGGCDVMVATLRTPNLFPIAPYAQKIAESVIALINDGNDRCVELFFDDNDLFIADIPVNR
jgi:hypothetical protein